MSIRVSALLDGVREALQDKPKVRWTDAELVRHVQSAYSEIVLRKPELGATVVPAHNLTATASRQQIPATAFRLLAINSVRNGTNVANVTAPVQIDRVTLSSQDPSWTLTNGDVSAFVYEPDSDPLTFYLYPRPTASSQAELVVAVVPSAPINESNGLVNFPTANFALPVGYVGMVQDYVLYRAYAKDGTSGDANKSIAHYNLFMNALNSLAGGAMMQQPN